jgi:hypothetical protein
VVDRLLTLFAPRVVALLKRTNDDFGFFVITSAHEHRALAPCPTIGPRSTADGEHVDLLSAVYEYREWGHFHLSPDAKLLIGESEV